jgi:hypothetical protein
MTRDLLTRGTDDHLTIRPEHLDVAAKPDERHTEPAALEADEAVTAHAARDDHIEGLADPPQRLQVLALRVQRLLDARPGHRTTKPDEERGCPLIQRRLQRLDIRPLQREEVTEVVTERTHAPLGFALVLALPRPTGVDVKPISRAKSS